MYVTPSVETKSSGMSVLNIIASIEMTTCGSWSSKESSPEHVLELACKLQFQVEARILERHFRL